MNKWTRRAFITSGVLASGVVIFGIAIRPGNRASKVAGFIAEEGETLFNIWVKISPSNLVTVIIPHAEMGQGVHTTLAMMLADELDADWSKVRFMEAPAHKEYANYALIKGFLAGEAHFPKFLIGTVDGAFLTAGKKMNIQITGGSASVRFTGMHAMRVAGAATRSMLLQAAASEWNVPESELTVKDSYVSHQSSNRSAPFSEFAKQAAQLSAPTQPKLKSASEFTLMGTSPPRLDIPAKVDGSAGFGIDVNLPNMKYATIKAAPVFGSKVKSADTTVAESMAGVRKVVVLEDAVAVIADGYWIAKQALNKIDVEYEPSGNEEVEQDGLFEQFAHDMDAASANGKEEKDLKIGDTKKALASAKQTYEAVYKIPYLAHATMEPMNCTAWVHDGECEIWTGSQNPLGFANDVAEVVGLDIEQVAVHNQFLGGGFGRRSESDVAKQAARIAMEVDYPVKLIWSREEDIRHDFYREANISRFKAGLDENGQPISWDNQFLMKHHPEEAPYIPYQIDNQYIHYTESPTHIPWGNWRSVDHSKHGFFTESFIDELALFTHADPYLYRRGLLSQNPRMLKVLDLAAEKGNWSKTLPENWGRGIAIHQSFGTIVAEVVEVEVPDDGQIKIHRIVCAVDPGQAIHTNGLIAQMESGIIYGLTAALYGEITIEEGAVAQSNFHDYQMVRMNEAPKIETHIINSGNWPGGAGEPSTPCIAPALANAIFSATGTRVRELPIRNYDLSKGEKGMEDIG